MAPWKPITPLPDDLANYQNWLALGRAHGAVSDALASFEGLPSAFCHEERETLSEVRERLYQELVRHSGSETSSEGEN